MKDVLKKHLKRRKELSTRRGVMNVSKRAKGTRGRTKLSTSNALEGLLKKAKGLRHQIKLPGIPIQHHVCTTPLTIK